MPPFQLWTRPSVQGVSFWLAKAIGLWPWLPSSCNRAVSELASTWITQGLPKSAIDMGCVVASHNLSFSVWKAWFSWCPKEFCLKLSLLWGQLMVLQSLQNWGYNLENMRKSNHPPDLLLGFWDLHVLNGGHFIRIWAPFIRSDDMPHKFDLALSKATFLNIKCETRLFDDLQKLFQIH